MGAKQTFIDKIIKLNSQGLSGDAMSRSKDDAKKEAEAISALMLSMKVPPGVLCIKQTTGGVPNPALIKLMDMTGATIQLSSALTAINSAGASAGIADIVKWAKDYAAAISEFCVSVGIAKNSIITNPAPAAGVPNPPIPIVDLAGALPQFQTKYVDIKRSGATDPVAVANIATWSGQVAGAISAFVMQLVVPAAAGFTSIANTTPPISGIPNPTPLPLVDS